MRVLILALTLLHLPLLNAEPVKCDTIHDHPSIRYLGVGAFDIRYQNQRVLTDPFYSPHSYWDVLFPYTPDIPQITKVLGPPKANVDAIFIGHGHYDHAADLPAIQSYLNKDASIFSSQSSEFIFNSFMSSDNLHGISESEFGKWIHTANGWIRFKAYASEHAPQALGINLFPKKHTKKLNRPPKYMWDWSQGTNINWLIDFLAAPNSNKVIERIFIQTSASEFPIGLPEIDDNIIVDKVFLAAASFENVDNYPTGIIKALEPKSIFFIHWENFFTQWYTNPSPLALIDLDTLLNEKTLHNRLKDSKLAQPNHCY